MVQFVGFYVNPGLNVSLSKLGNWLTLTGYYFEQGWRTGLEVASLYLFYDDHLDKDVTEWVLYLRIWTYSHFYEVG